MPLRMPRRAGVLLKTGQLTQYSSELDDGFYQAGLLKRYEILTTGSQSGTVNIDLIHLTVATIDFEATTPGTINDSGADLAMFKTGETIVVSGSGSNDGVYTVSTGNVAGTIRTTEPTLLEAAGATVSIAKREAHSNECVQDLVTGRMWSRYTSAQYATMGTGGDGLMPWTGQVYDIFQYAAVANAASLGGYADWRIPNSVEIHSLSDFESLTWSPDLTAFPTWTVYRIWSSTGNAKVPSTAMFEDYANNYVNRNIATTTLCSAALVRGGV